MKSVRVFKASDLASVPEPVVVDATGDLCDLLLSLEVMAQLGALPAWTLLSDDEDVAMIAGQLGWEPIAVVRSFDEVPWEATVVRVG